MHTRFDLDFCIGLSERPPEIGTRLKFHIHKCRGILVWSRSDIADGRPGKQSRDLVGRDEGPFEPSNVRRIVSSVHLSSKLA
jgi:hypothetical protein